jgi:signal transduction histidine kinase
MGRPLRALAYLVTTVLVAAVTLILLPVLAVLTGLVGLPLAALPVGAIERRRVRLLGQAQPSNPHRPPRRPGLGPWLRVRYGEAATWRTLAYALLLALLLGPVAGGVLCGVAGSAIAIVSVPLAYGGGWHWFASLGFLALLGVALVVATYAAKGIAALARGLVGGQSEDTVRELTSSRARLVDAFEVERRRIERDLHDGAQQRLVSLSMTLGLAEMRMDEGPAKALVGQAAHEARAVLGELRELVRGIHPQVLADHGLAAAVDELADRSPVPVKVHIGLSSLPPSTVESAAYFVIAEALTNVARHAKANGAGVSAAIADETLIVTVTDDGQGGADPDRGSGLAGLVDRVDALGGTLTLSSPLGGPTVLRLELPCSA